MQARVIFSILCLATCLLAAEKTYADEPDDSFVRASVAVVEPGDVLYSRLGHAFIRMECSVYNLDYCFSYESEDVKQQVLSFLAGKLKMGMVSIPTDEFLQTYALAGRGVKEYELRLSLPQKQKLWELLDNMVAEGMNLPYDYMERGCALSCAHVIEKVLPESYETACKNWPETFHMTRRELVSHQMHSHPWTAFLLYHLVGTEGDEEVSNSEKIVTPKDLISVLQHTVVDGHTLIEAKPHQLVPTFQNEEADERVFFTPLSLGLLLLLFTVFCIWRRWRVHVFVILAIQTLIGVLLLYLVCLSSLPCTNWNWLLVPFNPFPLLLWRWRRHWLLPFSAAVTVWLLAVVILSHQVVDMAHYVLALNIIVTFLYEYKLKSINKQIYKQ